MTDTARRISVPDNRRRTFTLLVALVSMSQAVGFSLTLNSQWSPAMGLTTGVGALHADRAICTAWGQRIDLWCGPRVRNVSVMLGAAVGSLDRSESESGLGVQACYSPPVGIGSPEPTLYAKFTWLDIGVFDSQVEGSDYHWTASVGAALTYYAICPSVEVGFARQDERGAEDRFVYFAFRIGIGGWYRLGVAGS